MSFFTKSETATIPFSTFTTTDKGIVQTGTVESVTVSIITGIVQTITRTTRTIIATSTASSSLRSTLTTTSTIRPSPTISTTVLPTSTSSMPTTLVTITTTATPSLSPTAGPVPTFAPSKHLSSLWWVAIIAMVGLLLGVALIFLWRKCARKSYNSAGCFLHAVFETIGSVFFGKQWDKWKATRDKNRRKQAEFADRLSSLDDEHVRNYFLRRLNDTVPNYKNHGTIPEQNSPPSTVPSGETWRNVDRDTAIGSPVQEAAKMTNKGARNESRSNYDQLDTVSPKQNLRNKREDRDAPLGSIASIGARPDEPRADISWTEVTSQVSRSNKQSSNTIALWPEPPHTSLTRQSADDDSLNSYNQWFPYEISSPDLRNQIQEDIQVERQATLDNIELQSNASFRGAKGVWSIIHPQPLPAAAKTPPLASAVISPLMPVPPPTLPPQHPILRVPTAKLLPKQSDRSSRNLHVPPLHIHRTHSSQRNNDSSPDADCGPSSIRATLRKPRNKAIASFLGWNKVSSRTEQLSRSTTNRQHPGIGIHLAAPPPMSKAPVSDRFNTSQTATRHTSISGWTDASVAPTDRAGSSPLHIERWTSQVGVRCLKPSTRAPSLISREGLVAGTDGTFSPRIPGFNTNRNSVTSAYSGFWEDDYGGKIDYDHTGRIRDVEFEDHAKVSLNKTPSVSDVLTREQGEVDLERRRSRSQVDLMSNGYQRDCRGNWI